MNEMMKNAAINLAYTAGKWNDAKRCGSDEAQRLWNQIYAEKASLLNAIGFEVLPEVDKNGYVLSIRVGDEQEEVHGLFR